MPEVMLGACKQLSQLQSISLQTLGSQVGLQFGSAFRHPFAMLAPSFSGSLSCLIPILRRENEGMRGCLAMTNPHIDIIACPQESQSLSEQCQYHGYKTTSASTRREDSAPTTKHESAAQPQIEEPGGGVVHQGSSTYEYEYSSLACGPPYISIQPGIFSCQTQYLEMWEDEIDFDFIKSPAIQGYKTTGYVPSSGSGVTICAGFDLKTQSADELRKFGVSQSLIMKLTPYFHLKGANAKQFLWNCPLQLSQDEANEIDGFMIGKYLKRLKQICSRQDINYGFLPQAVRTVLFSRVVHHWNLKKGQIQCVKDQNYDDLAQQLKKLEGFGKRGTNEANYLRKEMRGGQSKKEPDPPGQEGC